MYEKVKRYKRLEETVVDLYLNDTYKKPFSSTKEA